ncbi:MAG: magnesium transporter CorA family protein [Planctomycetota bacterium]|jgi:magnesium transporter
MSTFQPNTLAYSCAEDARLRVVEMDDAVKRWSKGEGTFVISLDAWAVDDLRVFLDGLSIGEEAIESVTETGHAPRVRVVDGLLLCEIPTSMDQELSQLVTTCAVCLDRMLLIVHDRPSQTWTAERVTRLRAVQANPAGILATMLAERSADLRRDTGQARRQVVALARRMDVDPDQLDVEEIVQVRNTIIDLDAIVEERIPVLESLLADRAQIREDDLVRDEVRVALTDARATARRLERIDRRLTEVQNRFDAHLQEKINRRLSRLTIISAIFLPLTLVAGIYGMNFEAMPELRIPFAYPITIGGMIVIAVGMLVWFKRRGWMD